jgi:hypothetical protein
MMTNPVFALIADTLLVRPVDVPAPWYSVATGVLSVVVTLLLLGIAVALLGMARALKGAESRLGGSMKGLADELIPLARNLNQIATQLSEVTTEARGDLRRLSGTIGAVDEAVRDVIDAGEERLARFGTLLDAVQDEAQATVASATGVVRGIRTGTGSLVSDFFGRRSAPPRRAPRTRDVDDTTLDEDDIRARLAALEAAFKAGDDDDEDEDDFDDELIDDTDDDTGEDGEEDEDGENRLDADEDDDEDDEEDDEDLLDDDDDDADDEWSDDDPDDDIAPGDDEQPRSGGPRVRPHRAP